MIQKPLIATWIYLFFFQTVRTVAAGSVGFMQNTLFIDEILREIFHWSAGQDLPRAAQVCRAWKDPALDALYESLTSLKPLLDLLLKFDNGDSVLIPLLWRAFLFCLTRPTAICDGRPAQNVSLVCPARQIPVSFDYNIPRTDTQHSTSFPWSERFTHIYIAASADCQSHPSNENDMLNSSLSLSFSWAPRALPGSGLYLAQGPSPHR